MTAIKTSTTTDSLTLMSLRDDASYALDTRAQARCVKKHRQTGEARPWAEVWKISRVVVRVGGDYEARVNARRLAEGKPADFKAAPRSWGKMIPGTPLVEHNGKLYVRCTPVSTLAESYHDENDNLIDAEAVAPYLPTKSSNADHQGVDEEVKEVCYAAGSIINISPAENYRLRTDTEGYAADTIREAVAKLMEVTSDVDGDFDGQRNGYASERDDAVLPGRGTVTIDWSADDMMLDIPAEIEVSPKWAHWIDAIVSISNPRRIDADRIAVDVDWN